MSVNEQKNEGISPVLAAVAGVVVCAVAIAGAVALSDKKNMAKVKGAISNAKDKAKDYVKNVQSKVQGQKKEIESKEEEIKASLIDSKEKVKKTLSKTADSVSGLAQKAKKEVNKT